MNNAYLIALKVEDFEIKIKGLNENQLSELKFDFLKIISD